MKERLRMYVEELFEDAPKNDNADELRLLKEALVILRPKIQPKKARSPVLTLVAFLVISAVDALFLSWPTNGKMILLRLSHPIKAA